MINKIYAFINFDVSIEWKLIIIAHYFSLIYLYALRKIKGNYTNLRIEKCNIMFDIEIYSIGLALYHAIRSIRLSKFLIKNILLSWFVYSKLSNKYMWIFIKLVVGEHS